MAKDNLVKLAKGNATKKLGKSLNTTKVAQKVTPKEPVKKLSPEEERDLKAKQRVEELLQDVSLTINKNNEVLIELDTESKENVTGKDWLEEQMTLLSKECERLRNDLAQTKEENSKLLTENQEIRNNGSVVLNNNNEDSILKPVVVRLFNEIQANYFNMVNPMNGKSNLVIPPIAFMNRLIMFFPFLSDEKRF